MIRYKIRPLENTYAIGYRVATRDWVPFVEATDKRTVLFLEEQLEYSKGIEVKVVVLSHGVLVVRAILLGHDFGQDKVFALRKSFFDHAVKGGREDRVDLAEQQVLLGEAVVVDEGDLCLLRIVGAVFH